MKKNITMLLTVLALSAIPITAYAAAADAATCPVTDCRQTGDHTHETNGSQHHNETGHRQHNSNGSGRHHNR